MRSENLFTSNLKYNLYPFQEFDCAFEIVGPGFLDVTLKGSERAIRFWCSEEKYPATNSPPTTISDTDSSRSTLPSLEDSFPKAVH